MAQVSDPWVAGGILDNAAHHQGQVGGRLAYASNRRLWLAVRETWRATEQDPFAEYAVNGAWEFRYDGDGRERYMARQWTTPTTDPNTWRPVATAQWTDYRGSAPYGDYAVEIDANQTAVVTETRRFLFGLGAHGQETLGESGSTVFLHGDLIGSTMLTVNAAGQVVETPVYTAFGEPVTAGGVGVPPANPATRYGYAGAWGYESGLLTLQGANTTLPPITLLHVGERWYQPGIGRFVQRDPIGIWGGMNVYAYIDADPMSGADPEGLQSRGYRGGPYKGRRYRWGVPPWVGPRSPKSVDPPVGAPDSPISDPGPTNIADACVQFREIVPGFPPYSPPRSRCPDCPPSRTGPCPGHIGDPRACGATGLEAGPIVVWWLLAQRRQRGIARH